MKKMLKMLTLLSILLILGSCSSSKGIVNIDTPVPDGQIAIKIVIDRKSFGTLVTQTPDQYDSDFEIHLQNLTKGDTDGKLVAINQNILVNAKDVLKISGSFNLDPSGYGTVTPEEFKVDIFDTQSRTLQIRVRSNGSGGTKISKVVS